MNNYREILKKKWKKEALYIKEKIDKKWKDEQKEERENEMKIDNKDKIKIQEKKEVGEDAKSVEVATKQEESKKNEEKNKEPMVETPEQFKKRKEEEEIALEVEKIELVYLDAEIAKNLQDEDNIDTSENEKRRNGENYVDKLISTKEENYINKKKK